MTTIDPQTGLPQLPDDMFWRVGYSSVEIRRRLPDGDWQTGKRFTREDATVESRTVDKPVVSPWWRIGGERTAEEHQWRYVNWSETVAAAHTDQIGTMTRRVIGAWGDVYESESAVRAEIVSKETVSALAVEALATYEAALIARRLRGDYPPKTLGSTDVGDV